MSDARSVTCSSCGGEVPVKTLAARTATCPYCQSLLIVNEAAVRAVGKLALLTETPSCLAIGWPARCLDRQIDVLGRLQFQYRSGFWDEWWIRFQDDGSYAWISQDEGEYMLERPLPRDRFEPPDYDQVKPGDHHKMEKRTLWIEERDIAQMVGAQGELPRDVQPGGKMRYLDLTDNEAKVTFEYFEDGTSEGFVGRYLKPRDLIGSDTGIETSSPYPAPSYPQPAGHEPGKLTKTAEGIRPQAIQCAGCGGSVELRDAQGTMMVVCQYCGSGLDVSQPGAVGLIYEAQGRVSAGPIEIGASCHLHGHDWTVLGRVRYRELDDSGVYVWEEYQLFNRQQGYIFLEEENGHWLVYKPLRHAVQVAPQYMGPGGSFSVAGQTFKAIENSRAEITYVEGELTWVARLGDRVSYLDAVRPPQVVSAEWTEHELEWSQGHYLKREEVAAALGCEPGDLPTPTGVAPAQPFERSPQQFRRALIGAAVSGGLFLFGVLPALVSTGEPVMQASVPSGSYLSEAGYVSAPFEIPDGSHICKLTASAPGVNNSWVAMSVAILDDQDNVLLDADTTCEYYHGTEGGESWSEGDRNDYVLFRLTGPQTYRLNVFGEAGTWSQYGGDQSSSSGASVQLTLERGVRPARYFMWAALLAAIYPLWEFGRQILFLMQRSGSDDDDD